MLHMPTWSDILFADNLLDDSRLQWPSLAGHQVAR